MGKRKFVNQFCDVKFSGIELSQELCDKYDPLPVLTPKEAVLRLMAGGQIRENELRKTYYGEQYDCSDNMDYIDELHDFQERQKEYYQHLQQTYKAQQVDDVEKEVKEEKDKGDKEGV